MNTKTNTIAQEPYFFVGQQTTKVSADDALELITDDLSDEILDNALFARELDYNNRFNS